jgi:ribonuclease HI
MDLVASFTHDVEIALSARREVTMITMDVQGAFDALLRRRLLKRMTKQGFPLLLLRLVDSFLRDREVRVRLEQTITTNYKVECGTPQGSPLSPVLYMLYLAELFWHDKHLRFGYADDVCLHQTSHSLDRNVEMLAQDVRDIIAWGKENKIAFAPEKLEMIHITGKGNNYSPPCIVNNELTITPTTEGQKAGEQPAIRWLGVWFDRKLNFRRHITERARKARVVAYHIRGLARTVNGPPASALRKATITCVLPSLLYGTEAWYAGRTKINSRKEASTRVGFHVDLVDKTLALAARGVLPVYRTTPTATLYRDAGLPSAMVALEEAKIRFAMRLQTVDTKHPLVARITPPMITKGPQGGIRQRPKTRVQRLGTLIKECPRPRLVPPHFTPGCRKDPTGGIDKRTASEAFKTWWKELPPTDVTVFSDGSEQHKDGSRYVGYGFAIYQNSKQIARGCGSINNLSHVFDAEAIGAWKGLEQTIKLPPETSRRRIWLCIDSTSVIWCTRGDASSSSQWAFLRIQDAMRAYDVRVKWAPGHTGIEGNEAADALADRGAMIAESDEGHASQPTVSGIRTIARAMKADAQEQWWRKHKVRLSTWYQKWGLRYAVKTPAELGLPRHILHRLLAIRTGHGDFAWYHRKYKHANAQLTCRCREDKTMMHVVLCRKTHKHFRQWPQETRPLFPPTSISEATEYLRDLMKEPDQFAALLEVTGFYSRICTQ